MVGLVGAVLMPHNLFLHSSLMIEPESKVDQSNLSKFKETLTYRKLETGLSLLISFLINVAVISTFAHYSNFT